MKEKNQITASTLIRRALATQNQTNKPSSNQESKAYDDTKNSNQLNSCFKYLVASFQFSLIHIPPLQVCMKLNNQMNMMMTRLLLPHLQLPYNIKYSLAPL